MAVKVLNESKVNGAVIRRSVLSIHLCNLAKMLSQFLSHKSLGTSFVQLILCRMNKLRNYLNTRHFNICYTELLSVPNQEVSDCHDELLHSIYTYAAISQVKSKFDLHRCSQLLFNVT
jgi:hypothetical protein